MRWRASTACRRAPSAAGWQKKPDSVFAKARAEAAREIAARAALGAKAQIGSLQQRVAENQRAAEVRAKLHQRLDEDVRARDFALGSCLKSEDEALADATETGLVVYASPGSYDRELDEDARKALVQQLERYDSMTMSDKDAANVAAVLLTAATNAAALVPDTDRDSGQSVPTVLMEPQSEDERPEVVLDGSGTA